MVLYVDETECPEYFIVTGLLVKSRQDVELAYRHFLNKISASRISKHYKKQVFTEFKSTLIDRNFQNIKTAMLTEINAISHTIIFCCYKKKEKAFSQKDKERSYINMIAEIVSSTHTNNLEICFDCFNKRDFEVNIIKKLFSFPFVTDAHAQDSQREPGLKFVDNLCSVIRLHKTSSDSNNYWRLIESCIKEV